MRYIVVKQGDVEIPVLFPNTVDHAVLAAAFPEGTVIAAGDCVLQEGFFTCQGHTTIAERVVGSRGHADEILLRSIDYMFGNSTDDVQEVLHYEETPPDSDKQ